jgi:hypothetical protein
MWLIRFIVCGHHFVWPSLATTSLSTNVRSADWYPDERPPVKEVHPKTPKRPPKEQLFLHRPVKASVKVPRVYDDYLKDFTRLLQGPIEGGPIHIKGTVNVPIKREKAFKLRSHGTLKPFGAAPIHKHRVTVQVPIKRDQARVRTSRAVSSAPPTTTVLRHHQVSNSSAAVPEKWSATKEPSLLPMLDHDAPAGYKLEPRMAPPGRQAPPGQPVVFHSNAMEFNINIGRIFAPAFFVAVILALIFALCFSEPEDIVNDESRSDNAKSAYPKSFEDTAGLALQTANTKANLLMLENSPGTWARTYRRADRTSQEALELLFRCNIIPVDEFAVSNVSQEHIDECVWISTQMLREKSLGEWVEEWPQAMKTFEESVTACFAARTDVISNLYGQSPPNSPPMSETGFMDCRVPGMPTPGSSLPRDCRSTASPGTARSVGYATQDPANILRSVRDRLSITNAALQDVSTSQRVSVRPPLSTPSQADSRSSVVSRCREIMSTIPTHASLHSSNLSGSGPRLDSDARAAKNPAPGSPWESPSSDTPFREIPPTVPSSLATLGRLDSYPPSERQVAGTPGNPGRQPVDSSASLVGDLPLPREHGVSFAGLVAGLEGTTPKSKPDLPSAFLAGAAPHSWEPSPRWSSGTAGTTPHGSMARWSSGLPGTTPQQQEIVPREIPATSLSPRGPIGPAPLVNPPSLTPREPSNITRPLRQDAAVPSSSDDPFASSKELQAKSSDTSLS